MVFLIMLIAIGIKIYGFCIRNPRELVQQNIGNDKYNMLLLFNVIYEFANVFSTVSIYALFFICAIGFLFYKWADFVAFLLPSEYTEEGASLYAFLKWWFISTLVLKSIAVVMKIVHQSRADIFIMDWENYSAIQRDQQQNPADKENPVDIDMTGEDHGPVAWRSIFVANELNELQTEMRKIEPATTLIWFTAFYIGLGW